MTEKENMTEKEKGGDPLLAHLWAGDPFGFFGSLGTRRLWPLLRMPSPRLEGTSQAWPHRWWFHKMGKPQTPTISTVFVLHPSSSNFSTSQLSRSPNLPVRTSVRRLRMGCSFSRMALGSDRHRPSSHGRVGKGGRKDTFTERSRWGVHNWRLLLVETGWNLWKDGDIAVESILCQDVPRT